MTFWIWLVALSAAIALLERVRPARPAQRALRPQLWNDVFYLAFNGYFRSVATGGVAVGLGLRIRELLAGASLVPEQGLLYGRHPLVQFGVYLVASDFLQWCVHVLLHRVPFLWQFHKVHHSVREMDWIANFRFHWMELVVYRALLFVPLVWWLGGDPVPLFAVAVLSTAWGHFNHANLAVELGPLGYVFNGPRMHLWHHDASDEGGVAKNFGIVFSVWDWLFRSAYWPRERAPERLGYPGDAEMPRALWRQIVFPLGRIRTATTREPAQGAGRGRTE